jgi:DNA-binding MurR/RpiR family transcriptional regulator
VKQALTKTFLGRIRAALPELHPAERRLGEFLCDFPGELASYDAQELARLANVSKATVSRFVRRLDYASYDEARRHAREDQRSGSRLFLSHPGDANPEASLLAAIEQSKANLDQTFTTIPQAEIDAVAKALLGARKVWIVGFRASHPLADYLRWQLTQVIENVVAIPGGGETLGEHLASVSADDCVIVFGLRRRVAGMEALLDYLAASRAPLAYVTDEGLEPDRRARWHLRCHTASTGPLFNHVSVMALCHVLITRTIDLSASAGRSRLRRIEAANDSLNEL